MIKQLENMVQEMNSIIIQKYKNQIFSFQSRLYTSNTKHCGRTNYCNLNGIQKIYQNLIEQQ